METFRVIPRQSPHLGYDDKPVLGGQAEVTGGTVDEVSLE
jgi:hypothetical protein